MAHRESSEVRDGLAPSLDVVRHADDDAFGHLLEQHRRELRVHCYRMLGSFEDAEDLVQETFVRAWRRRVTYQARSSFRAWLYKIATNSCLDFLERRQRRPRAVSPAAGASDGITRQPVAEITWLQPFPDHLLEPAAPSDAEPDAVVVAKETIELAFLAAIQHLPPRQRAVLILRDVLDWPAAEVATLLDGSVASVKSALQRARATVQANLPPRREEWAPAENPSEQERELLRRYISAHERGDLQAVAQLLADDVRQAMPPHPFWLAGRDALLSFTAQVFDPASPLHHGRWHGVPTRANRQPAVAYYVERPTAGATVSLAGEWSWRGQVLDVLRIEHGRVAEITSFEPQHFPAFGLPLAL